MGTPKSLREMRMFLMRMFCDPNIIPYPKPLRYIIAIAVSIVRHSKSWEKYNKIGGSPLKEATETLAGELQKCSNIETYVAYSYSNPQIKSVVNEMVSKGITDMTIIPMYPQWSYSTTRSILQDIERVMPQGIHYTFIKESFNKVLFTEFWVKQIQKTIEETGVKHPTLLFSAHSVPQSHIEKGDSYEISTYQSAQSIADSMSLPFRVGFQSKIGRIKWVEPDTISVLKELSNEGIEEILIIPISFLTENLETLYDIDVEIIPQFNTAFKTIKKVSLAKSTENLIPLFHEIVLHKWWHC